MKLDDYEFLALEDISIPPYSNTGVTTHSNPHSTVQSYKINYDWFEGLIAKKQDELYYLEIEKILHSLDVGFDGLHDTKTQGRYLPNGKGLAIARNWQHSIAYLSGSIPLLTISYGGSNDRHGDYFVCTGKYAHLIVDTLKRYFMAQCDGILNNNMLSIKRVDVAIDVRADFDFIVDRVKKLIPVHNLKPSTYGNWLTPNHNGRTLYLGHTKNVEMRIYEKGYEQRDKGIEDAPLDWVRFELQVRVPKGKHNKLMKKVLAAATASEIFHSYKFCVAIISSITGLQVDYTPIQYTEKPPVSTFDQKLKSFADQYGDIVRTAFESKEGINKVLSVLYPEPDDIPFELRHLGSDHIRKVRELRFGDD